MHDKYVRRRRVLIGVLVAISLILLTAYFGAAENSPLHSIQRGIVAVFTPIQDGASKVFSPVKDLAGYVSSTIHAKSQNKQLRAQIQTLRKTQGKIGLLETQNAQLRKLLNLDSRLNIANYDPVSTNVIGFNPSVWYETIRVDKGAGAGIKVDDPVISDQGLVGKVTSVGDDYAVVSMLSSPNFQVEAKVEDHGHTAIGTVQQTTGNPTNLQVTYLHASDQVNAGDEVVTAGYSDPSNKLLKSLYPPGIPIGSVTNATYDTLASAGTVDMSPYVNPRSLDVVQILTKVTN